jgi:hypothetical protein
MCKYLGKSDHFQVKLEVNVKLFKADEVVPVHKYALRHEDVGAVDV